MVQARVRERQIERVANEEARPRRESGPRRQGGRRGDGARCEVDPGDPAAAGRGEEARRAAHPAADIEDVVPAPRGEHRRQL